MSHNTAVETLAEYMLHVAPDGDSDACALLWLDAQWPIAGPMTVAIVAGEGGYADILIQGGSYAVLLKAADRETFPAIQERGLHIIHQVGGGATQQMHAIYQAAAQ